MAKLPTYTTTIYCETRTALQIEVANSLLKGCSAAPSFRKVGAGYYPALDVTTIMGGLTTVHCVMFQRGTRLAKFSTPARALALAVDMLRDTDRAAHYCTGDKSRTPDTWLTQPRMINTGAMVQHDSRDEFVACLSGFLRLGHTLFPSRVDSLVGCAPVVAVLTSHADLTHTYVGHADKFAYTTAEALLRASQLIEDAILANSLATE